MDVEAPRDWDPQCPKCQEELRRLVELSQSIYDDLEHGATSYPVILPACTHHTPQGERGGAGEVP
jgi:hypothetical protein